MNEISGDAARIAAVKRALAQIDLAAHPVWQGAIAGQKERGWKPSAPWQGLDTFAHVEIGEDRFLAESTVEYGYCCPCHGDGYDVHNFEIEGRFDGDQVIIETIRKES